MKTKKNAKNRTSSSEIRQLGVLIESVNDNVKVVAEQYGDIKRTLDSHTEIIVGLKEDVEVIKEDVGVLKKDVSVLKGDVEVLKTDMSIVKTDIEFIKGPLKKKVDVDEFMALERRVADLEKKR